MSDGYKEPISQSTKDIFRAMLHEHYSLKKPRHSFGIGKLHTRVRVRVYRLHDTMCRLGLLTREDRNREANYFSNSKLMLSLEKYEVEFKKSTKKVRKKP